MLWVFQKLMECHSLNTNYNTSMLDCIILI